MYMILSLYTSISMFHVKHLYVKHIYVVPYIAFYNCIYNCILFLYMVFFDMIF